MKLMFVFVPPLKFQQSNWSLQLCLHNILFMTTLYVSFQYPTNSTKMTTEVEARTSEWFYVPTGHKDSKIYQKTILCTTFT